MPPAFHNTCAIIITHHPDAQFPDRLERVSAQFSLTIIVDNASVGAAAQMLDSVGALSNVQLEKNMLNLGIGAALNRGLDLALQQGYEWVLTLDQDTLVYPEMREILSAIHIDNDEGDSIVGGNYWNANRQRNFMRCRDDKRKSIARKTLITSGTLLSIALAKRIGGFREDYFIDSVDHEFCLRARAHGCKILMSCEPVMHQSIGSAKGANWAGRLSSFNHSSLRKYFIARNTTATVKSYCVREPAWAMRQAARLLFDFISILLFEESKIKKVRAFLTGFLHGLIGKSGPVEQAWPHGAR